MTKKNTLQERSSTELDVFDPSAMLTEASGNDDISASDCAMPYLQIASPTSDVCIRGTDKYIDGLSPGQMYNTVTKEFFDRLTIIPCQINHAYQAWTNEAKGKPQGEYQVTDDYYLKASLKENANGYQQLMGEDGNILQETYTYLVLYKTEDGKVGQAILPMSKTKLKAAKQWNTQMRSTLFKDSNGQQKNPPKFMQEYILTTVPKQNNKGSWSIYDITFKGLVQSKQLFEAAQALSGVEVSMKSEEVKAPLEEVESVV